MKRWIVALIGLAAGVAIAVLLQVTHPDMVGPVGVLAFFVLLYVAVTSGVFLLLELGRKLLLRFVQAGKWRLYCQEISDIKLYYYASVIALAPIILLGMQSVGGIRLMEGVLVVIFEILALVYVSKRS